MVTGDLMNTSLRRSSYKWSVQALTFLLISLLPFGASAQRLLEYRSQVPVIDYAQSANDAFTRLFEAIDAGDVSIAYKGERGYLDEMSVLLIRVSEVTWMNCWRHCTSARVLR